MKILTKKALLFKEKLRQLTKMDFYGTHKIVQDKKRTSILIDKN